MQTEDKTQTIKVNQHEDNVSIDASFLLFVCDIECFISIFAYLSLAVSLKRVMDLTGAVAAVDMMLLLFVLILIVNWVLLVLLMLLTQLQGFRSECYPNSSVTHTLHIPITPLSGILISGLDQFVFKQSFLPLSNATTIMKKVQLSTV